MTFRNVVKAIPAIFDTATTSKHEMSFEDFIHEIKNIANIGLNITRHTIKSINISVSLNIPYNDVKHMLSTYSLEKLYKFERTNTISHLTFTIPDMEMIGASKCHIRL